MMVVVTVIMMMVMIIIGEIYELNMYDREEGAEPQTAAATSRATRGNL